MFKKVVYLDKKLSKYLSLLYTIFELTIYYIIEYACYI